MKTKDKILLEAMKLFSVSGFEAVSIRAIANAVGVGNSALYKHYQSKQAILDAIIEESKKRFCNQYSKALGKIDNFDEMKAMCLDMYRFQTEDEWMVMFRRLLIIEQYKNPKLAQMYHEFFIEMPIQSQEAVFKELIEEKVMKDRNPRVMAMELYGPFFLYHTVREEELEKLFEQHVDNFIEMYSMKE